MARLRASPGVTGPELTGMAAYHDRECRGLRLDEVPLYTYSWRNGGVNHYAIVAQKPMSGRNINQAWYIAAPNKSRGLNTQDMINDNKTIKRDHDLRSIHEQDLGNAWSLFFRGEGQDFMDMVKYEVPMFTNMWKPPRLTKVPVAVWTAVDGQRRFVYKNPGEIYKKIESDIADMSPENSTPSQILGVQFLAALSSDITSRWPRNMGTPHGGYEQFMGPIQAAVASLFTPEEWKYLGKPAEFSLVNADILKAAEEYVAKKGYTHSLGIGNSVVDVRFSQITSLDVGEYVWTLGAPLRSLYRTARDAVSSLGPQKPPPTRAEVRRQLRELGHFKKKNRLKELAAE